MKTKHTEGVLFDLSHRSVNYEQCSFRESMWDDVPEPICSLNLNQEWFGLHSSFTISVRWSHKCS